MLALLDRLLAVGGIYGDPQAGGPIQYDELRTEHDHGDVEIVVYNRAVLLFTNDSEALSPGVPLPRGCRATTPSRSTPWDGLEESGTPMGI